MLNIIDFVKRLEGLFQYYGLSAAAFADKIEVPRSSISHLLSGRNKPSLEFVLKIVQHFEEVDLYWLIFGEGVFPPDPSETKLPDNEPRIKMARNTAGPNIKDKLIERVIVFYTDGSFKSYEHPIDP